MNENKNYIYKNSNNTPMCWLNKSEQPSEWQKLNKTHRVSEEEERKKIDSKRKKKKKEKKNDACKNRSQKKKEKIN